MTELAVSVRAYTNAAAASQPATCSMFGNSACLISTTVANCWMTFFRGEILSNLPAYSIPLPCTTCLDQDEASSLACLLVADSRGNGTTTDGRFTFFPVCQQ